MMPIPTPAPIEPSPAPTPSAIALPASVIPVSVMPLDWAMRSTISYSFVSCASVTRGGRASEVDSGEDGEDECLQGGDQDHLEDVERERHREGQGAQGREPEQHRQPAGHEQDQQVAGEDVGKESYGKRDQADEVRDHLDSEDRGLADRIHVLEAGRKPGAEVAEDTMRPDALKVV